MTRYRCAAEARARDEPLAGTASLVRRWILVEQAGAWGRDAVVESGLPAAVATGLGAVAEQVNARLILIRRPGGGASSRRRCFVVRSDRAALEELVVDDVTDLLDVDWAPLGGHQSVGGAPVHEPLYLVCTNGRHDACCAEFGRPLVKAMAAAHQAQTWECSHIGGDRFAGNLVCMPHGLYYGHVEAPDGPRIAALHERGLLDLAHYRGRSCHPFVVQAAEHALRAARDLRHVDDLIYCERRALADDEFRITFASRDATGYAVDLRVWRDFAAQRLTCQAGSAARPPRYELLAITVTGSSPSEGSSSSSSSSPSRPRR